MKVLTLRKKKDKIEIKVSLRAINRLENHKGYGTYLSDIKKDEVCITKSAFEVLMTTPERAQVGGMEFWPGRIMAWGLMSLWCKIPIDEINVPAKAKPWMMELFKIVK